MLLAPCDACGIQIEPLIASLTVKKVRERNCKTPYAAGNIEKTI
jgi:hypothetical protein